MEPANLHHHQHQQYHQLQFQDQFPLIGISPNSSSSSYNSCYGVSTTHTWTPCTTTTTTTILNSPGGGSGFINSYSSGAIINITSNSSSSDPLNLVSMNSTSTTQDLGFHIDHQWANNIKQENSYPRFTQMLKSPSSIEDGDQLSDMNAKLLLGTLSNSGLQLYHGDNNNVNNNLLYSSNSNRGRLFTSQIYPTINVSNLNINQPNSCSSLDMNLQPLDLINSTRYGGSFSQTYGLTNHFQHSSSETPINSSTSISAFSNGMPEAKRTSNTLETNNKGPQNAPKKSRVDSRASCPPFKVRKEKLGDRIAALQQMVAPFGKTDTASVLMEAIGYIKFLQSQVETLSVPYMKSSRSKASRSMHGGNGEMNNGNSEGSKRDLRSRGLCLVPLSCLTYVTDGGGGVWPPPNFTGAT